MTKKSDRVEKSEDGFIFVEGVRLCRINDKCEIEIKGWTMRRGHRKPKMGRCTIEELMLVLGQTSQQ